MFTVGIQQVLNKCYFSFQPLPKAGLQAWWLLHRTSGSQISEPIRIIAEVYEMYPLQNHRSGIPGPTSNKLWWIRTANHELSLSQSLKQLLGLAYWVPKNWMSSESVIMKVNLELEESSVFIPSPSFAVETVPERQGDLQENSCQLLCHGMLALGLCPMPRLALSTNSFLSSCGRNIHFEIKFAHFCCLHIGRSILNRPHWSCALKLYFVQK